VRVASRSADRSDVQRVECSCASMSGSVGSGTGMRVAGVRQFIVVCRFLRAPEIDDEKPEPTERTAYIGKWMMVCVSARIALTGIAAAFLGLVTKRPSQIHLPSLRPMRSSRWYEIQATVMLKMRQMMKLRTQPGAGARRTSG